MAQISSTKQKKKSLCEKSMLLVANIIKLSSLSFVTVSFGTKSVRSTTQAVEKKKKKKKKEKESSCSPAKVAETTDLLVLEPSRSHKSQEPENGSKPRSYLILEPRKVTQKEDIDERADDFVRRTREKIKKSHDLNSATRCKSPYISEAPNIVGEVSLSS